MGSLVKGLGRWRQLKCTYTCRGFLHSFSDWFHVFGVETAPSAVTTDAAGLDTAKGQAITANPEKMRQNLPIVLTMTFQQAKTSSTTENSQELNPLGPGSDKYVLITGLVLSGKLFSPSHKLLKLRDCPESAKFLTFR